MPFGSDAALKSRGYLCFFQDVGVEGFFAFQDSVDDVKELGHYGADDDDGGFAFLLETLGEGFADRIEAHGRHGGKEQGFADVAVARLAHRGARFAAGAALEDARRDSRVGCKLTSILEQR